MLSLVWAEERKEVSTVPRMRKVAVTPLHPALIHNSVHTRTYPYAGTSACALIYTHTKLFVLEKWQTLCISVSIASL